MPVYLYKETPEAGFGRLGGSLPEPQLHAAAELAAQRDAAWQQKMRRQLADPAASWPELFEPSQGGTAGPVVDTAPLWERAAVVARFARDEGREYDDLLDALAEEIGGLPKRLRAGLQSLGARRDGNVSMTSRYIGKRQIQVTIWSDAGCFSRRGWWARTIVHVATDQYGEVMLKAPEAEIVVTGSAPGTGGTQPHTTFTDRSGYSSLSCTIGRRIVSTYEGMIWRAAIRQILADGDAGIGDTVEESVEAQEFLEGFQAA